MSYTGTEIFALAISVIDELSESGAVNETAVKEYKYRAPYLLDAWAKENAKNSDQFSTYEVSCFRKINNLGDLSSFNAVEHTDTDLNYETEKVSNCFFFSVDAAATVYVEELINGTWTACNGFYITYLGVATAFVGVINAVGNQMSYKDYKGVITPTSPTNKTRLRFSGAYYYRFMNRALSPYKFQTADKVSDFKAWYRIDMPIDFKSRTQVISQYPEWIYESDTKSKWENGNELYIQFGYEGIIRVNYVPIPVKITTLTQTIAADDITVMSAVYYLAKMFAIADQNTELANVCSAKYKELKAESMAKETLSLSTIVDVYS